MKISCHTLCNWMASLHCNSLHELWCGKTPETSLVASFMDPLMVLLSISILRSSCNTLCNWMAYLQCDSLHDSSPDVEKLLSYLVHFNGCFLHGSSDHLFKSLDHEKLLPHFMHLNGFSPLWFLSWIMMWKSSWDFNGFFPSWILGWYSKYFDPEKPLPHFVQLNGFSPVWFPLWIFTWCGKAPETSIVSFLHGSSDGTFLYFDPEKLFPRFVQLNGFSPVWFHS